MELNFTAEDQAFRAEVNAFIDANYPDEIRRKSEAGLELSKEEFVRWQKILHKQGWIAPKWPVEFGGTGWTPTQRYIFEEELTAASTPRIIPFGLAMLGPVLMEYASKEQQARYLPAILSSDTWWAQGYSEPGAGSDLASLKMRAESQGDNYLVNGSKIWTTYGHYADWIFCLVRTSQEDRKQKGISFLLIDMDDPGISVSPIITADGKHVVNQVFFEDVLVPKENLVGEEGAGWGIAKFLLGHERTNIAGVAASKRQIVRIKEIAAKEPSGGQSLLQDQRFRDKLSQVEIDLLALEYTNLRVLSAESSGQQIGPEASLLKVKGTEVQQKITELLVEAAGYYALPYDLDAIRFGWQDRDPIGPDYAAVLAPHYFDWRKSSIYGGSTEVQKNIISKAVLGL